MAPAPDYALLDRYARHRYRAATRIASTAAKTLLPLAILARRTVAADPVDVVLLQPNAATARRNARLREALSASGLTVREEIVPRTAELLRARKLAVPAEGWSRVPRRWRLQAAYAAWIVAKYRPRLAVTFMDDSFHTPFLRRALAGAGGVLANMAHTICFPNVDFSMCDVDWFVLFGRRSLDNLRAAPQRYGSCRAIVAGSPYLVEGITGTMGSRVPASPPRLLWLGQYLHPAQRASLTKDLASLARFAREHPEYPVAVRLHPLDAGETRRMLEPLAPGIRWLDPGAMLPEVVGGFDIVASSFSAGLIDAAACGKPVIAFTTSGLAPALGLADAGLPLVDDAAGLEAAVRAIAADYGRACDAAMKLAAEHYHLLDDATPRLAKVFAVLARGGDVGGLGLPVTELG